MQRLADSHAPEFLEIAITMPQAKLLYLLGAAGELHMSDLVAPPRRLAVHDQRARRHGGGPRPRLPPRGSRRPPPGGRRADAGRTRVHRPLPGAQRPPDARAARASSTTHDLAQVRDALAALAAAAGRIATRQVRRPPAPPSPRERIPHEPPLRVRRRQAERHAAAGRGAVHRRHPRLGQPQAGAPPGHRVPGHHRHRAAPGRRRRGRRRAGDQADRAGHLRRAAPRGPPVHLRQLAVAWCRAVRVRDGRQGDPGRDRAEPAERRAAADGEPAGQRAQHQRVAGDHRVHRRHVRGRAGRRRPRSPGPRSSPRCSASRASAASTSPAARSSRSSSPSTRTSSPPTAISIAQVTGVLAANNLTFPSGQITTDDRRRSRSPRSAASAASRRSRTWWSAWPPPRRRRCAGRRHGGARPACGLRQPPPRSTRRLGRPRRPGRHAGRRPTPVTIGDLGTVEIAGVATTGYARTDGKPSLSLSVSKTSDANTVSVAEAVTGDARRAGRAVQRTT